VSVAEGDEQRTLDNFALACRFVSPRDGLIRLPYRGGGGVRGRLRGATPTHILLVGLDVPLTKVKTGQLRL
jgi:hypothetical protein